ncbi:efflux RND transporter periplasmic adaptor subunit [Pseudomonas sp. UL073]|uniref:Efflux RND transporter periplasmic adaptor subunit n=1 Tax=Zestomonas insulae TaxID=2809017 RepID=A0ABS2IFJ4_9GAMM|nr:efflux RND transporter periplasmic adaptor subunit [Pseudomonas insulae]MBM7061856.1 efflux RND transporter periplasmic adaptor subunit [Pseudomonas insulae]
MRPFRSKHAFPTLLLAAVLTPSLAAESPSTPDALDDPSAIRVLLTADVETTLSSQMGGTLGELRAALGQKVAKDALLAQFNCSEADARSKVAAAELTMARQNLEAKRNLRKLDAVGDLEVAMASTEVQKAEGARSLAQAQSGYCKVLAPFNGRVAKVHAKPYQTVSAGTPLFDLVSDGPLKVRLNVPSNLLQGLTTGKALQISIHETGKSYPAHISAVNSRVDAVAQTVELEARLDAEYPELIAGMSGTARFADDHE